MLKDINIVSGERANILMIRVILSILCKNSNLHKTPLSIFLSVCAQRCQGSKAVFKSVSMSVFLSPHFRFCVN